MAEEPKGVTVIVETYRNDAKVNVSVAELGVALTVANRIVNRLAVDNRDYRRLDSMRYEPDWIALDVREVRQGSIILQAHEILQDPYVQGRGYRDLGKHINSGRGACNCILGVRVKAPRSGGSW